MRQILALGHARKSYDGKVVLDDVTLAFLSGAKIGVVGHAARTRGPANDRGYLHRPRRCAAWSRFGRAQRGRRLSTTAMELADVALVADGSCPSA